MKTQQQTDGRHWLVMVETFDGRVAEWDRYYTREEAEESAADANADPDVKRVVQIWSAQR